jgi:para-aminobenzoate synthetase component 1
LLEYIDKHIAQDAAKPILSAKHISLPTTTKPEALFAHFANTPWSMWLDSSNSKHIDSRFDIIVWQPIATLVTQANNTKISILTKNALLKQSLTSTDDPLALIETLQKKLFNSDTKPDSQLPFLGGAMGYLSYDLGRRFEKLPKTTTQDINLPEMAMGLYNKAIIFDKTTQKVFLLCDEKQRKTLAEMLINFTKTPVQHNNKFQLKSAWQANMSKANYLKKFAQVQEYLLSGDCYQINLAQRFSADYQGSEFDAYLALRAANKAPFSAFIRLENATILSVSPERFLRLSAGNVQSKPIKGTMPRSNDAIKDAENAVLLKNSSKDSAENLMIVDLLRNDISRSCQPGSVNVPKLFDIESFPAVHHLVSTVEGTLADNKYATDLLRGAFPGGSITGAPKIRAMEIIEELEPHQRSVYCGSIGYLSACGTMDTSITIRTLVCQTNNFAKPSESNNKIVHCWAGGGLVADSVAASEYQETLDKVNCILPVLSKLNQV